MNNTNTIKRGTKEDFNETLWKNRASVLHMELQRIVEQSKDGIYTGKISIDFATAEIYERSLSQKILKETGFLTRLSKSDNTYTVGLSVNCHIGFARYIVRKASQERRKYTLEKKEAKEAASRPIENSTPCQFAFEDVAPIELKTTPEAEALNVIFEGIVKRRLYVNSEVIDEVIADAPKVSGLLKAYIENKFN